MKLPKLTKMLKSEFKSKLRFEPYKLSTYLLKKYLVNILNAANVDELFDLKVPELYVKCPDSTTDYKVLIEMGKMALTNWKSALEANPDNIESLYIDDDMMVQDSTCFYQSWKIIHEEVSNHEKQMSFFRLVSEMVKDLSSRSIIEISYDGARISENGAGLRKSSVETIMEKTTLRNEKIEIENSKKEFDDENEMVIPQTPIRNEIQEKFPIPSTPDARVSDDFWLNMTNNVKKNETKMEDEKESICNDSCEEDEDDVHQLSMFD